MGEDGGCTGMEARTEDRLAGLMNEQTDGSLGEGEDEWMCLDANMQTCTKKCQKIIISLLKAMRPSCFSHTVRGKSHIIETLWRLLHLLHHVAKTRGTLPNSANRCYYD